MLKLPAARSLAFLMTLLACLSAAAAVRAQNASVGPVAATPDAASAYDPRLTFAPLTLPDPVNVYRSSNGAPGPEYWQNEADYELHATLDPAQKTLTTTETITYTNKSPDTLESLWVQLEQNIYRSDSRGHIVNGGMMRRNSRMGAPASSAPEKITTDGFVLKSVEVETGGITAKADYMVNDTRMQIRLAKPLQARGGHLKIIIDYSYEIPGTWGGRTSWVAVKDGEIYDMAQWYPR
ncbi:MAG: hypothetical protein WBC92_17655, partial [Terracidiphilus sp.]